MKLRPEHCKMPGLTLQSVAGLIQESDTSGTGGRGWGYWPHPHEGAGYADALGGYDAKLFAPEVGQQPVVAHAKHSRKRRSQSMGSSTPMRAMRRIEIWWESSNHCA